MKRKLAWFIYFAVLAANAFAQGSSRVEKPLVIVTNPPPVQMLVPGFTVRELPLDLNNINNLVYAPDGRLFALCYDGNVLQLTDSDGDGLEDKATHFFNNEHNDIPPSIGMAWGPGGLYIPSQGRVIRLRDKGDGTGELETVTGGWVKPTSAAGSNLDSIGIAVDAKGDVYFALGADAWNQPYRINKATGKSDYRISSERGTVLKISPDWKTREIISTGTRFPVSMAFNAAGDLFVTDQEGATWLPNGNPFDELLHIQPGRHYGFPPRHPQYLPNVIDEPSVFDYAPQHQSTCGLHFNEPVTKGAKTFGPSWWRGDAIVCGESRGKIWRTKLVKSAAGYVARTDLIACLSMLTMDAVPTPQGDLIVTCHSGSPDWGTGPKGKGKLFKISYTDPGAPQPVLTYATVPTQTAQTRIVFDRDLRAEQFRDASKQSSVTMGRYVTAAERFETFRPGYQVVKIQRTMPRFELPVEHVQVEADKRTLSVVTDRRDEAVNYALTVPMTLGKSRHELDVISDLTGVEASWRDASGKIGQTSWLPHPDLKVARGFTSASAEHTELFGTLRKSGSLRLNGQLDLWQMLHPAVQPESRLDYEYPPETVTVVFKAKSKLEVKSSARVSRVSETETRLTTRPGQAEWVSYKVTLATGNGEPTLEVSWFTAEDSRSRALPLRRVLLPWAHPNVPVSVGNPNPEMAGGNWERGRKLFFSEQAACFKCHQIHGEGGALGPNLSNLIYRDYASVWKDITEPSAAINPDHIAYNVELKDGGVESGVLVSNNDREVVLGQATGQNLTLSKSRIAAMNPSAISIMPEGLLKGLEAQQQKDLMTFLLTLPPFTRSK